MKIKPFSKLPVLGFGLLAVLVVSGCGAEREEIDPRTEEQKYQDVFHDQSQRETIFGKGGLNFFGDDGSGRDEGGALGVNSFLWRASLDTISFMPVNSADPFGGVIITDWHTAAESPNERFKLNIYILGRSLRADGLRVAIFRQVRGAGGLWQDAAVPGESRTRIEDAILTRARQIRNAYIARNKE